MTGLTRLFQDCALPYPFSLDPHHISEAFILQTTRNCTGQICWTLPPLHPSTLPPSSLHPLRYAPYSWDFHISRPLGLVLARSAEPWPPLELWRDNTGRIRGLCIYLSFSWHVYTSLSWGGSILVLCPKQIIEKARTEEWWALSIKICQLPDKCMNKLTLLGEWSVAARLLCSSAIARQASMGISGVWHWYPWFIYEWIFFNPPA